MNNKKEKILKDNLKNLLIAFFIFAASFAIVLMLDEICSTDTVAPMVYMLAVFLTSLITQGYIWGIIAALVSVVAVNYAFTFPYFKFSLTFPDNIVSAIIMLIVAIVTGVLTTKLKMEERLRTETEKEKLRANLLRAVSHDLRTPLTTIYGSCSAIIENYDLIDKPKQIKLLSEMREDCEWLVRMVENLLSVTRIDGRKVSLKKTPTVLEELIDEVLTKFEKRYPNQEVETEIPDDFISIPMDSMLIEQVLLNLMENAVLHANGMTKIRLRVFNVKNIAVFEVYDNGTGISTDELNKMFTHYHEKNNQSSDSSKHNMGIGLPVCSAIITAHGGKISAESGTGGTAIRFTLKTEDEENE